MIDQVGSQSQSIAIVTAAIAISTSLSAALPANGLHLVGIQMPAAWDAATITFAGSADGLTFFPVKDNTGAEVIIQAAASLYIAIPPTLLPRVPYLQLRSGTSGTPVNQTAARSLLAVFGQYS